MLRNQFLLIFWLGWFCLWSSNITVQWFNQDYGAGTQILGSGSMHLSFWIQLHSPGFNKAL